MSMMGLGVALNSFYDDQQKQKWIEERDQKAFERELELKNLTYFKEQQEKDAKLRKDIEMAMSTYDIDPSYRPRVAQLIETRGYDWFETNYPRMTFEGGGTGSFGNTQPYSGEYGDNVSYVFNELVNTYGFTPELAAASVGNFMQESTDEGIQINPRAVGDNGASKGIGQWNEPAGRWQLLNRFAKERGLDPWNIDTQLSFYDWELRTKYADTYESANSASSVAEATAILTKEYWIPGDPHLEKRVAYATGAYNTFVSDLVPDGMGSEAVTGPVDTTAGILDMGTPVQPQAGGQAAPAQGGTTTTQSTSSGYEGPPRIRLRPETNEYDWMDLSNVGKDNWRSLEAEARRNGNTEQANAIKELGETYDRIYGTGEEDKDEHPWRDLTKVTGDNYRSYAAAARQAGDEEMAKVITDLGMDYVNSEKLENEPDYMNLGKVDSKNYRQLAAEAVDNGKQEQADKIMALGEQLVKDQQAVTTADTDAEGIALRALTQSDEFRQASNRQQIQMLQEFKRTWETTTSTDSGSGTYTTSNYTADLVKYMDMLNSPDPAKQEEAAQWLTTQRVVREEALKAAGNLTSEAKVRAFMDAGMDERTARLMATGAIDVRNDGSGRITIINKGTGQVLHRIDGAITQSYIDSGVPENVATIAGEPKDVPMTGDTGYFVDDETGESVTITAQEKQEALGFGARIGALEDPTKALGFSGFFNNIMNTFTDAFNLGSFSPDAREAEGALKSLRTLTMMQMVSAFPGVRDSVMLKKEILKTMPTPNSITAGPARAIEDFTNLENILTDKIVELQGVVDGEQNYATRSKAATSLIPIIQLRNYFRSYRIRLEEVMEEGQPATSGDYLGGGLASPPEGMTSTEPATAPATEGLSPIEQYNSGQPIVVTEELRQMYPSLSRFRVGETIQKGQ